MQAKQENGISMISRVENRKNNSGRRDSSAGVLSVLCWHMGYRQRKEDSSDKKK